MISCIAIDDEPLALEIIEQYCSQSGLTTFSGAFTKTSSALRYLETQSVDLIFLDIQMPEVSGIELYSKLKNPPMVIFTTAHPQYAVEGFNLNAIDYLLKPIEYKRFLQGLNKALDVYKLNKSVAVEDTKFIMVRSEYSLVKINFSEIQYIESFDDYIKIHVLHKKPVMTKMSIKNILEKLPAKDFVRIHRSYVVPLAMIESVRGKNVVIGPMEIPIGQKYEEDFFRVYTQQHFY